MIHKVKIRKNNKYTNLTSLINDNFRVINGILLHEAVIVKPKHIVLLKKRVLTKNFTVFIKFWRFNAFFDEAFTVTSRSKTIAALRHCHRALCSRWQCPYYQ
jgi:hypothetical protein